MKEAITEIHTSALLDELRWFVANRWIAGAVVALGGVTLGIWGQWGGAELLVLSIGVGILAYNAIIYKFLRGAVQADVGSSAERLIVVAWFQLLLDFSTLTLLTILSGGIFSPILGLFILHMVFASILLPRRAAYLAATAAILMVYSGLHFADLWDTSDQALQIFFGWIAMLILTVHLASHITSTLRGRDNLLRQHHQRMRGIVETAADGIISFDRDGIIESANTRAQVMFGYPSGALKGISIGELMPLPYAGLLDDPQTGDMGTRHLVAEFDCTKQDGAVFPGEAALTLMRFEQHVVFTTIVRDITDHKTAENELHTLNRQLKTQQESMIQHEKMVAVGRMAAGVAHEIANPLSNIDSMVQLAVRRQKPLSENQLGLISEQVKRISNIINQLKGFAHPDETDWQTVAVDDLINKALAVLQFDRRHQFIDVVQREGQPPCLLRVQPQSLQQVLINILVNALDATEESSTPKVQITFDGDDEETCRITVTDNGMGIETEHLKEIFDPFYTTKPVGKGTGLGLSICQKLIERHQGRIEVNSAIGEGTSLCIILPISLKAPVAGGLPAETTADSADGVS